MEKWENLIDKLFKCLKKNLSFVFFARKIYIYIWVLPHLFIKSYIIHVFSSKLTDEPIRYSLYEERTFLLAISYTGLLSAAFEARTCFQVACLQRIFSSEEYKASLCNFKFKLLHQFGPGYILCLTWPKLSLPSVSNRWKELAQLQE